MKKRLAEEQDVGFLREAGAAQHTRLQRCPVLRVTQLVHHSICLAAVGGQVSAWRIGRWKRRPLEERKRNAE